MRYLVKDSKKMTQSAPTMNSSTWNLYFSFVHKVSATTDELKVTVTPESGSISRICNTYSGITNGHRYFVRSVIKKNDADASINRIVVGASASSAIYSKTGITTASGTNLTVYVSNSTFTSTDVFSIKIEAFDLTEDFGAGNEPADKAFCEEYYGADYKTKGTHYKHIDYYVMNGRNNEMEVIG